MRVYKNISFMTYDIYLFVCSFTLLWCFQTGSGAVSKRGVCLVGSWDKEEIKMPQKSSYEWHVSLPSLVFHKSIPGAYTEARGEGVLVINILRIMAKVIQHQGGSSPAPNTFYIYRTYNLVKEDHYFLVMIR